MLSYTSSTIKEFNGGLTDRVVDNKAMTFDILHNFRLDKNANPYVREGFRVFSEGLGTRCCLIYKSFDDRILGLTRNSLFYENESGGISQGGLGLERLPYTLTSDDNMYSFESKGIKYITVCENSYQNVRQPLALVYQKERTVAGSPDTYKIYSQHAGCPEYNGDLTDVNGDGTTEDIQWIVLYRQEITANENNGNSVTVVNYGLPRYMDRRTSPRADCTVIRPSLFQIQSDYVGEMFIDVYRASVDQSSTYYYVGSCDANNPVNINNIPYDTVNTNDDALSEQPRLYINEGIVEMSQPPKHTCSTIINGTAFYGNIAVADTAIANSISRTYTEYGHKVMQSMVGNPAMCSSQHTIDFDEKIVGLAGLANSLIVLTGSKIYRVDGLKLNDGSGSYSKRTISDDAGCVSARSVIVIDDILYFCGNHGVYATDGYKVSRISTTEKYDISDTYAGFIRDYTDSATRPVELYRSRISATHNVIDNCIEWTVCSEGSDEPNAILVFDLYNSCFYTLSGFSAFYSSVYIDRDSYIRADDLTYIYKHDKSYRDDSVKDIFDSIDNWNNTHVRYNLKSSPFDFGDPSIKKWVQAITAVVSTRSKAAIGLVSYNDNSSGGKDLKSIVASDVLLWRDENLRWNDPTMKWRRATTKSYRRHFPKRGMRCRYKQFEIKPTDSTIYDTALLGTATVTFIDPLDPSSSYVDLEVVDKTWPSDLIGYTIKFLDDNYTVGFLIRTIPSHTRITIDGGGISQGSNKSFIITGIRKKQEFTIENITMQYAPLKNVGAEYRGEDEQ